MLVLVTIMALLASFTGGFPGVAAQVDGTPIPVPAGMDTPVPDDTDE